ncbi:MAG: PKD domain-containing protein [Saprospiraceae bacterium]
MFKPIILSIIISTILIACAPGRDDEFNLGPTPEVPQFSAQLLPGDSNRVVVKNLSEGNFQLLWDLPGGSPKTSNHAVDTILYTDAGEYTISLFVSSSDGNGTVSASQKITIVRDAPLVCSPKLELLTGCGSTGKCWTFSTAGGAVKVGPTYGDFSWYTSPENGLQDVQYDDSYCFTFLQFVFQNDNNGQSINPWDGYIAENYNPGLSEFQFLEGTGMGGRDQIILPDDQFMGTWDTDNVMDIVSLATNELILRARICAQDGTPAAEGWFELTFVPR